ncbi:MAG: hypothetical protein K9J12_06180 [Melioribacteraceae bacterium]|nr:hypothetical protein [Melioribacteraceae bacterium]MCF8431955.1 hypothetical protein [Melioribacteraceae bacterium]
MDNEPSLMNQIQKLNQHINNSSNILFSDSELATYLTDLYEKNPNRSSIAYVIIVQNQLNIPSFNSHEKFQGLLDAMRFLYPISEDIEVNDFRILNKLKTDFQNNLTKYNQKSESELDQLVKAKQDLQKKIEVIEKEYTDTHLPGFENVFNTKLKVWEEEKTDLANAYDDLLKLQKPAQYWKALKTNYEEKGKKWVHLAIWVSAIFVIFLVISLWFFPEWMKGNIGLDQVKGIIIFTIIASTFSYLIYTFIRLATSAYHLSRDADERRQLTYLYLSLLKDGAVEPSEREIVLQALFARADTGLIKGDGTPQMPFINPLVSKVMESANTR